MTFLGDPSHAVRKLDLLRSPKPSAREKEPLRWRSTLSSYFRKRNSHPYIGGSYIRAALILFKKERARHNRANAANEGPLMMRMQRCWCRM